MEKNYGINSAQTGSNCAVLHLLYQFLKREYYWGGLKESVYTFVGHCFMHSFI